jgi:hypothetical protein
MWSAMKGCSDQVGSGSDTMLIECPWDLAKMKKTVIVASLLALSLFPRPALAMHATDGPLPLLTSFVEHVAVGEAGSLVGVYAPGHFALEVVQQPKGRPAYISESLDQLTQFGPAGEFETTVLLAHNVLGGEYFPDLSPGVSIILVAADGGLQRFTVTETKRFQALHPNSLYSQFLDLDTGRLLRSSDLADEMYNRPSELVLQTCIEVDGLTQWGRLFVIATPDSSPR